MARAFTLQKTLPSLTNMSGESEVELDAMSIETKAATYAGDKCCFVALPWAKVFFKRTLRSLRMLLPVTTGNFCRTIEVLTFLSVVGRPSIGGLCHPEYVIYRGEQSYPEYLITYLIQPQET